MCKNLRRLATAILVAGGVFAAGAPAAIPTTQLVMTTASVTSAGHHVQARDTWT